MNYQTGIQRKLKEKGKNFPSIPVNFNGINKIPLHPPSPSKFQPKEKNHNQNEPDTVTSPVHNVLHSPGRKMEKNTREFMESRFGFDFTKVRIHTNPEAAISALSLNASAYTLGNNIVFGPGQYNPHTQAGKFLLAHEITHVLQQKKENKTSTPFAFEPANVPEKFQEHNNNFDFNAISNISSPQENTLQRGPGAAAYAGIGLLGFLLGFGGAFAVDYLSMTRERAENYGKELDTKYPGWRSSLPDCPCTMPDNDPANWEPDASPDLSHYHPGAVYSFRSTQAANRGSRHGQQCTYDASGNLITSGAGAGTPDVYSPTMLINLPYHVVYDVKTWKELGWSTYNQYWVPNQGTGCENNESAE